jgi:hypothetical protein
MTRLADVGIRPRTLSPERIGLIDGLPTLTVERTIADLLEQWTDRSLVTDALRDAAEQRKLLSAHQLATFLEPISAAHGIRSGEEFSRGLREEAGLVTKAGGSL